MLILTSWKADANISMRAATMIKGFPSFPKDLCPFTPNLKHIYHNIFWHKLSVSWGMLMAMYHSPLVQWLVHTLFLFTSLRLCSESSSESEQGPRLCLNSSECFHPQMSTCCEPSDDEMQRSCGAFVGLWPNPCQIPHQGFQASASSTSRVPLPRFWMDLTML